MTDGAQWVCNCAARVVVSVALPKLGKSVRWLLPFLACLSKQHNGGNCTRHSDWPS